MSRYCLSVLILLSLFSAILACQAKKSELGEKRSEGERLFVISCQSCHLLPKPVSKTDEEWPAIVKRYGLRAKLRDSDIAAITIYLVANN